MITVKARNRDSSESYRGCPKFAIFGYENKFNKEKQSHMSAPSRQNCLRGIAPGLSVVVLVMLFEKCRCMSSS